MNSYEEMPDNLPVPQDDGACDYLIGTTIPDIELPTTNNDCVNLAKQPRTTVIYCYPMTGKPDVALPDGWDKIPGARGCTPQSCSFRDHYAELSQLGADVFGISTQDTQYQKEMVERLHLPFPVISDAEFKFCDTLNIPTFNVDGKKLMKRVTIITHKGNIKAVHYPVFPSDADPQWVISYLTETQR